MIGLVTVALRTFRTRPWWFVGLSWYASILLPASGLVRSGLWPEHADRFIYLPSIGLFLIAACETATVVRRSCAWRRVAVLGGVGAILALALATRAQVRTWHDQFTLFEHAAAVTDNNLFAHHILGKAYFMRGDQIRAFSHFAAEKTIDPKNPDQEIYLGYTAFQRQDYGFARAQFAQALTVAPDNLDALYLMGRVLEATGDPQQAEAYYRKGLASRSPDYYSMRPLFKQQLKALGAKF